MDAFAELLSRLALTPGRHEKLAYLRRYFATQPDPDRGYALAALTGGLKLPAARASAVRALAESRTDPVLFRLSYDYVGDLAETVALIWPGGVAGQPPSLPEVVQTLQGSRPADLPGLLAAWLDRCDTDTRYALIKLLTGGLRVGLSARLAKQALAEYAQAQGQAIDLETIEEAWHGLAPPYAPLFAWMEGRAPRPDAAGAALFRPVMLAHPLEDTDMAAITPADFAAEWKWDGIRVQYVHAAGGRKLFSRGAEDISQSFPELLDISAQPCVLDAELLIMHPQGPGSFAELQKRLGRKRVTPRIASALPAGLMLYDLLIEGEEDLRGLPFDTRRARLEDWFARNAPARAQLSALVPFADAAGLQLLRDGARAAGREGLMLKRRDSAYVAGRVRGLWFKAKRAPQSIDAVLMYAQTGHGRRGGSYSDYTFGVWDADGRLVPVGKAYSGFTDAELKKIDALVRANTIARFGPVREVAPVLVLEIAFDAAQPSTRHRSGIALRFPRIARLRWDKPVAEADTLAALQALL